MLNFFNKYFVNNPDVLTITSVYGLTPPSSKDIVLRKKKIDKVKEMMGDKYLLAKPMQRLANATGN